MARSNFGEGPSSKMDLNFEDLSLHDLKSLFKERKDGLHTMIHQEYCAKKTAEASCKQTLEKQDNVLSETEQILTNVKNLYADIEELTLQQELESEELIKASQKLEEFKKRRSELLAVANAGLSDHDKQILEDCRTKIKLYEELTGIHLIHNCRNIHGYIGNKNNNYIKIISQDNIDNLWEEIGKAASADWSTFLPQNLVKHE